MTDQTSAATQDYFHSPHQPNLTAELHRLHERVTESETELRNVNASINRIEQTLSSISDRVIERGKTNWSVIAAWAAVVVTIIVVGSSGFIRDLNRVENWIQRGTEEVVNHMRDGHPQSVLSKVESLKKELTALERHVDFKIKEADVNLQREMRLLDSIQDTRMQDLIHEFEESENWKKEHEQFAKKWIIEHTKDVNSTTAGQEERILNLERTILGDTKALSEKRK